MALIFRKVKIVTMFCLNTRFYANAMFNPVYVEIKGIFKVSGNTVKGCLILLLLSHGSQVH